jgi:hypothetical protein
VTLLRTLAREQQSPPQQQPGDAQPGEQPGDQQPGEGQQPQPPQPGPQPATPPTGQPQQNPTTRSLQEALEGIDEELTFEEAIEILDALREQQQRQRLDQRSGSDTWPDY